MASRIHSWIGDHVDDPPRDVSKGSPYRPSVRSLVKIFVLAATVALLYEFTKALAFPHQTPWQSHATTVVVISVASTVAFYAAARSRLKVLVRTELLAGRQLRGEAERVNLSAAIEQASEAVMITNTEGIIQYVNPAFTRMTGYSSSEVIGQSTRILKSGSQAAAYYQDLWKTIAAGQVWQGELINRRKNGSLYREEMTITPVRDPRGGITSFIAIKHDTTERRRTEAAQRESEERFRTAFEEAPYGMCLTALDGRFLQVNAALCQMLGYSQEELLGGAWQNLTHPDDMERSRQTTKKFMQESASSVELTKRYLRKNGNAIWAQLKISVVKSARGAPRHFITHIEDITNRKRAEDGLRKSEEQLRLLLDSTAEAIYAIDLQGNCTLANPACLRMLGYTSPECLLGKNMHDVMHHSRSDGSPYPVKECRIYRAFRKGEGAHVDDEVIWRADGTYFPAEYWSYPVRTEGKVVGAVVAFLDITVRKRAEEALRASEQRYRRFVERNLAGVFRNDLEGRVSECNQSLVNLLGYTSAEELKAHRTPELYFTPSDRRKITSLLGEHKALTNYEICFRRKDGTPLGPLQTSLWLKATRVKGISLRGPSST